MQQLGVLAFQTCTPAEEIWALFSGKDFYGEEYARDRAVGMILLDVFPGVWICHLTADIEMKGKKQYLWFE